MRKRKEHKVSFYFRKIGRHTIRALQKLKEDKVIESFDLERDSDHLEDFIYFLSTKPTVSKKILEDAGVIFWHEGFDPVKVVYELDKEKKHD